MKQILLALIVFLFFVPKSVHAQEAWEITKFTSDIFIKTSGEVQVTEIISVDFHDLDKHGIYRDIPVIYTNEDGSKFYTEINDIKVAGDQYKVSKDGDFLRIRIGDPDRTISRKHEYRISYTVVGVLRGFQDYDELYWNVTGNYWDVPIEQVLAGIRLEGGEIQNTVCYVGEIESIDTCFAQNSGATAQFSAEDLHPNEGMTIAVSYPKGITELPVVQSFSDRVFSIPALLTFVVTLAFGIGGILLVWSHKGRDLWMRGKHLFDHQAKEERRPLFHKDTIVVEYLPPENLRPAEIGVLVDERADTLDVTGTIIDLATRGYLTITEEKKKWAFGSTDYTLTRKNKSTKELLTYEAELFERLFDTGESVKMSELKEKFYTDLKKVKSQLYTDMVEKGFFPSNPEHVRNGYLATAIIGMVVAGFLASFAFAQENEYILAISIAGILTGFNLLIFSRFMSRRTAKGYEMYRRIQGYRLFIENVEKHRQKFFEQKNMFNVVLPYAIVFGLTGKFAKAMQNMGVKPDTATAGWYHGVHAFNIMKFESSVSNFSRSMSSAMTSTPSSSGGSGGGGFSGGGFGGGGGGSW